jgi:hypothetical protein
MIKLKKKIYFKSQPESRIVSSTDQGGCGGRWEKSVLI